MALCHCISKTNRVQKVLLMLLIFKLKIIVHCTTKVITCTLSNEPTSVADPGGSSRIPDPYFTIPDPWSVFFLFRIPDSYFFHPGSRIRIKEFKYFNPKKWFLSTEKYDPGSSSRIRIFYPSRIQGSKRHRIPDPQHWNPLKISTAQELSVSVPVHDMAHSSSARSRWFGFTILFTPGGWATWRECPGRPALSR